MPYRKPSLTIALSICAVACSSSFSTSSTGPGDGGGAAGTTGGSNNSGGSSGSTNGTGGAAGRGGATGGRSGDGGGSTGGASTGGALGTGGSSTGGALGLGGTSTGGTLGNGGFSTGGQAATCQPVLNQANLDTGFELCSDGSRRRRVAVQCPTEKTTTTSPCTTFTCQSDSDCTQQPNGYCADAHMLSGYCGCYYGCRQDSDCGLGSVCDCGVVVGHCVAATCKTNDDCGTGYGCVHALKGTSGTTCNSTFPPLTEVYVCQRASDTCGGDKDCPGGAGAAQPRCLLDNGHLACGLVCLPTP